MLAILLIDFFVKLLKTRNISHVRYCQECFSSDNMITSGLWQKREEIYLFLRENVIKFFPSFACLVL